MCDPYLFAILPSTMSVFGLEFVGCHGAYYIQTLNGASNNTFSYLKEIVHLPQHVILSEIAVL